MFLLVIRMRTFLKFTQNTNCMDIIRWKHPPQGSFKLNCDGVVTKARMATFRGII